jgi:hypothetical protein
LPALGSPLLARARACYQSRTGNSNRLGTAMRTLDTNKFGFRIRTRNGLTLNHLRIHAADAGEARRKLERMYPYCEVLECRPPVAAVNGPAQLASVVSLITRRRVPA